MRVPCNGVIFFLLIIACTAYTALTVLMAIYVNLSKYLVKSVHVHTHTYTYSYTHTHTHTYTFFQSCIAHYTTHAHTHTVVTRTRTPPLYVLTTAARGQRSSPVTLGALSTGHRGLLDRSLRLGMYLTVKSAVMFDV